MKRSLLIAGVTSILFLSGAWAQLVPQLERGFAPGKVYQVGDPDNINIFNGNMVLTIPIGQRYPVGGDLSYGLTLVYNSEIWDYIMEPWDDKDGCIEGEFPSHPIIGEGKCKGLVTHPTEYANAGVGWRLSLGELLPPGHRPNFDETIWLYVAPDGSRHPFWDKLHETENPTNGVWYTRDGSYLRMRTTFGPGGEERSLEEPSGVQRVFEPDGNQGWRLARIQDRFGNNVAIDYTTPNQWVITDSVGRTQTVFFTTVAQTRVVDAVTLSGFDADGDGSPDPATYDFVYTAQGIKRSCKTLHRDFTNQTITVPLLTKIQMPEGLTYSLVDGSGAPAYYTDNVKNQGERCTIPRSGILNRLVMPTGGVYEWEFGKMAFPSGGGECFDKTEEEDWEVTVGSSAGVVTRTVRSASGESATWAYHRPTWVDATSHNLSLRVTSPGETYTDCSAEVPDETCNDTLYFFRTQACLYTNSENHEPYSGWDYGLPFTRAFQSSSDGTMFLSRVTYDGTGSTKVALRKEYVHYEHDQLPHLVAGSPRQWQESNPRVLARMTEYSDDVDFNGTPTFSRITSEAPSLDEGFDGLGHYRKTTRTGFGAGERSEITNYNPTHGTYSIDPLTNDFTGDFQNLLPTEPWVLDTYDFTEQTEGGVTARQEYCFDASNGKLSRKRVLTTGDTRAATDLVTLLNYDSAGNLDKEQYFGGDKQQLTGDIGAELCDLYLPALAEYEIRHEYQYGVRKKSEYYPESVNIIDNDIDLGTGLVAESRDVAGFPTSFEYDQLGRVALITPQEGAATAVAYTSAFGAVTDTDFAPAAIDVTYTGQAEGETLAAERFRFDGLGRLTTEERLTERGEPWWAQRVTKYTPAGWTAGVSTWNWETAAKHWTTYDLFNPFGRAQRVTKPDDKVVRFTFTGERVSTRKVGVGTLGGSGGVVDTWFTTTTHRDHLGRITDVYEPVNGSDEVHATYGYDVGNRLGTVFTSAPEGQQARYFNYDNRGFLASEQMPEKGLTGNGTVVYSNYDSRGHAGQVQDGPNDLVYTYDKAERLTRIEQASDPVNILEVRDYGSSNSPGDWSKGKLIKAVRHNFYAVGSEPLVLNGADEFRVEEEYEYGGIGGRVSQRTTHVNLGYDAYFDQSFEWDDLGVLKSVTYPQLAGGGDLKRTGPKRTVSYRYTNGFLTAVPGYALISSRFPNGAIFMMRRPTGAILNGAASGYWDIRYHDWMGRPDQLETGSTDNNWYSGGYSYDGAGNITQIGSDWYLYDGLSRLKEGTVLDAAKKRNYEYDGFGNLTSITEDGETQPFSVDHATNRLLTSWYDEAGNQENWGADGETFQYRYYPFNQIRKIEGGSPPIRRIYGYTVDGERIGAFAGQGDPNEGVTYTIRDLEGHVLREYHEKGGESTFRWVKDYVWGPLGLLATISPTEGTKHYSVDHLGTPRLVCDRCAHVLARHDYYPFGQEATNAFQDTERMKFTGHERDLGLPNKTLDDLDYMHARHFNLNIGRFLSVDPVGGEVGSSQSWNRYAYVRNNPLNMVDPTGEAGKEVADWVDNVLQVAADFYDQNTGGGAGGVALNTAVGIINTVISGAADTLRVGSSTGDAIGNGGSGEDILVAASQDAGRAGALALTLVGAAGSTGLLDDAGRAAGASPKPGSAGGPGAGKRFSQTTRDAARAEAGDGCVFCGTRTTRASGPNQSNIDHAIPKSRGGNNTLANAQNTCRTCNLKKGTQTTYEFLQKIPR